MWKNKFFIEFPSDLNFQKHSFQTCRTENRFMRSGGFRTIYEEFYCKNSQRNLPANYSKHMTAFTAKLPGR